MSANSDPDPTPREAAGSSPSAPASAPARYHSALTWRTGLVFCPVLLLLCYWTSYSEGVVSATSPHSLSPPMNILTALALLTAVVVPVHRGLRAGRSWAAGVFFAALALGIWLLGVWAMGLRAMALGSREFLPVPLWAAVLLAALLFRPLRARLARTAPLAPHETISVYVMMMVGTLVTSYAVVHFLLPTMVAARYFSQLETKWQKWLPLLPDWFGPTNAQAVLGFWKGDVWAVPWRDWLGPLAAWTVLVLVVVWVMLCLNVLLRRQWIDHERLSFPLVTLPLELARQVPDHPLNAYYRNPYTWAGIALPVVLHTINGAHQYYPTIPALQFRHINVMEGVQAAPWNAVRLLDITFYPCVVGISYLLTLEVSLSIWVFYLARKFLPVLGATTGWSEYTTPNGQIFPFADQQATGAWAGLVVVAAFMARREILRILRWTVYGDPKQVSGDEAHPLSYRTAALGVTGGTAFLVLWLGWSGMTHWVALVFMLLFLVWCVALTRIRAEAGMGGLTGPMTPQETMYLFGGSAMFGPQNLVLLQFCRWMTVDLRGLACIMPSQLEDFKMADTMRLRGRSVVWAIMFAIGFSLLAAYFILLPIVYQYGGVTMNRMRFYEVPTNPARELTTMLQTPRVPDRLEMSFAGFGAAFTVLLSWLRLHIPWWPLHPIGYAVGFSRRTIDWMWFSVFLGWLCKGILLRGGGMKLYRQALPLFLGFILGEFFMGGVFGLIGCLFPETTGYQLYP